MALATEMGSEIPIILADMDSEAVETCAKAAAQRQPCIVMVEEMDMLVRPSGAALGFLDGTDTPRNPRSPLVRDIMSGIFFMADDAFRVGEYVDTGRLKGTVEKITVRSVQLRHQSGLVHTVP